METPWKVIVAFVGVFVAGAVFGAFFSLGIGMRLVERPGVGNATVATAPAASNERPRRGQAWPMSQPLQVAQIIRRLTDKLDLTPAQRERVMPLIQRAVEDFRRQQANYFREDGYLLQRLQQDIAKELTPEQRTRLLELEERQRELLRKRQQEWQSLQKSWQEGKSRPEGGGANSAVTPKAEPTPKESSLAPAASQVQSSGSTSSATESPEKKE